MSTEVKKSFTHNDASGAFARPASKHRYTAGTKEHPVEANRYLVYIALACPWASRVTAFIDLLGLDRVIDIVSVAAVMEPTKPEDPKDQHLGWVFAKEKKGRYIGPDPIFGAKTLREVYEKCGDFEGKFTTPVLFDKVTKTIVNNESSEIIRMLNTEFRPLAKHPFDLYPVALRSKIDEVNDWVYPSINNGVYRSGFAKSQQAYDVAVSDVFEHLEKVEAILSKQRFICGDVLTEADVRLFETLVRFDHVYHTHFKCNVKRIKDYPNMAQYVREIYQMVWKTVDLHEIMNHYYRSHHEFNPTRIVARGPVPDFDQPNNRAELFPVENIKTLV